MIRHFSLSFVLIVSAFASITASHTTEDIDKKVLDAIREDFYKAVESEEAADSLNAFIEFHFTEDYLTYPPKILAYKGALEAVEAQYTFNPFSKMGRVISGLKKLDSAVEKLPRSLEVRFLRFAVLHNIPAIFGVGDDRAADLEAVYTLLLKADYSELNREIQKGIVDFVLKSERLEADKEKNLLIMYPDFASNE